MVGWVVQSSALESRFQCPDVTNASFAGVYPEGQIMDYPIVHDSRTAKDRFTNEEKRALDRAENDTYNEVRLAAEAHRQVTYSQQCLPYQSISKRNRTGYRNANQGVVAHSWRRGMKATS